MSVSQFPNHFREELYWLSPSGMYIEMVGAKNNIDHGRPAIYMCLLYIFTHINSRSVKRDVTMSWWKQT